MEDNLIIENGRQLLLLEMEDDINILPFSQRTKPDLVLKWGEENNTSPVVETRTEHN
jgi:hypothetical protein